MLKGKLSSWHCHCFRDVKSNICVNIMKSGLVLSGTNSGCVLAVGLSIETVKIPLLAVDVRHLVDK